MSKVNLQLNRYLYRLVNSFEALIKGILLEKEPKCIQNMVNIIMNLESFVFNLILFCKQQLFDFKFHFGFCIFSAQ